jgi:flagellar biosynthetic protein FlhB
VYRRDEHGERTEKATPLRRKEARQRGQVARSGDLNSVVVLGGAMAVLGLLGGPMLGAMQRVMVSLLDGREGQTLTPASLAQLPTGAISSLIGLTAGLLLALVALAALANVLQVGLLATTETIRPDWSRLSPAAGLRRALSWRSAFRVALAMAKIAAVGLAAFWTIRGAMPRLADSAATDAGQIAAQAGSLVLRLALRLGGVLLALAAADYLFQRWQYAQDLKMTRREVMDELKRTEGDPLTRMRHRKNRESRFMNEMEQLKNHESRFATRDSENT